MGDRPRRSKKYLPWRVEAAINRRDGKDSMPLPDGTSARLGNYKSFGPTPSGFETIAPINVIIGRNNTGKSALLDLIASLCEPTDQLQPNRSGDEPIRRITTLVTDQAVRSVFAQNTQHGQLHGFNISGNHYEFGRQFVDTSITFDLASNGDSVFVSGAPSLTPQAGSALVAATQSPFRNMRFRRIVADRDMKPEQQQPGTQLPRLLGDGVGATDLIRFVSTDATADEELVTVRMVDALNQVFMPDSTFSRIIPKYHSGPNSWEVFLDENTKGSIPLSASGSGLKTVLLVLAHLILLPAIERTPCWELPIRLRRAREQPPSRHSAAAVSSYQNVRGR